MINAETWSNEFCVERGKRGGPVEGARAHAKEMPF